jgi:hypothetical protein
VSAPKVITDGFIPTPGTITVNYVQEKYAYTNEWFYCSGGVFSAPSQTLQSTTGSLSNVVSYKVLPNLEIQNFVCDPPSSTQNVSYGIQFKQADGNVSLLGATTGNAGNIYISPPVLGVRKTYWQTYLTYGGGLFLYDSPPIPDPPV